MPNEFPEISALNLLSALASANAPVVLDIRLDEDVAEYPTRLPGAVAVAFDDAERQRNLAVNGAVVICHKGLKLSAGVTARLRAHGIPAWRLNGGHVGWTEAGLATFTAPPPDVLTIALEAPAEEVIATWAALRFTAPQAELLEVPRDDLAGVVARFQATTAPQLPPLPGMEALSQAIPALTLALQDAPPSATFPMLDLIYRGALRTAFPQSEAVQ